MKFPSYFNPLFLSVCLLFASAQSVHAATINAASCSKADVQNAVNAAVDGDKIVIPAGSCTWTSRLTVTGKGITLQGAGIGATTITNGTTGTVLAFDFTAGDPTTYVTGLTFNANNVDGSDAMILLAGGGLNQFRLHHFNMINARWLPQLPVQLNVLL